jgi:anti-sigma factor RsiW
MSKQKARFTDTRSTGADSCSNKQLHALLNRYQDNELEPTQRERVHAHLRECHVCREELDQMEQVAYAVRGLQEAEAEPSFNAVLMDRIKQKQTSLSGWAFRLPLPSLPSVAYSIVFLVCLGFGLLVNGFFAAPGQVNGETVRAQISQDLEITQLLDESQQLSLRHVQDQTFALLGDLGRDNGGQ